MTAIELRIKINSVLMNLIRTKLSNKSKIKSIQEKIVMLEAAYKEIEGWGHTYHWQKV